MSCARPAVINGLHEQLVRSSYKVLLGREPENDIVVHDLAGTAKDFEAILRTFLECAEFKERFKNCQRLEAIGFTYTDDAATNSVTLRLLRMLQPYKTASYPKIRVGRENDGGYVMLDDFESIDAAYSLGINDDVSWDLEIAKRGIPLFQYDHTIDALPMSHPLFHWSKIGIGEADTGRDIKPLHMLMAENGHGAGGDLILKCDIEGAEWRMLSTMPPELLKRFRQITIETHGYGHLSDKSCAHAVEDGVRALTQFHRVIHVHANNNGAYCIVGGIPLPNTLELTLVRADAYELIVSGEVFPTPLDQPCWPQRVDYALGSFTF